MSQQGHWYSEGAPPLTEPVPPAPSVNGMGIAGFVVGLISLCGCLGLLSPIALVLSVIGLFKQPRGWAVGGTIVSAIGCCCAFPGGVAVTLLATRTVTPSAMVLWIGDTFNLPPDAKTTVHSAVIGGALSWEFGTTQTVPQSLDELNLDPAVLTDGWGVPFDYQLTDTGGFILRSAGSDMVFDTGDDIVTEGIPSGDRLTIVPRARTAPRPISPPSSPSPAGASGAPSSTGASDPSGVPAPGGDDDGSAP